MNHVNLIGKICSAPKVVELTNGRKIAQFSLSTQESYLDVDGTTKIRKQWHRISAWGRWVGILEELGEKGLIYFSIEDLHNEENYGQYLLRISSSHKRIEIPVFYKGKEPRD
jgi:hypothetical protein